MKPAASKNPPLRLAMNVDFLPPESAAEHAEPRIAKPKLVVLDTVAAQKIDWTWDHRIQQGAINLVVGEPGAGKTMLICDIMARITTGRPWPDGSPCKPGSVILANAEDDPATVLRGRFDAAGGDPSKVQLLECIQAFDDEGNPAPRVFTLAEIDKLEMAADATPDCQAIIIDPIGSFIGGKLDSHRDNEVRAVLTPLAKLAQKRQIAVICVVHTRKSSGGSADERALGSRAFVGMARSVLHVMKHPNQDKKNVRLLLPGKANNAPPTDGLSFTIEGDPAAVVWNDAPVTLSADEAYRQKDLGASHGTKPGPPPLKCEAAKSFLISALANGPVASKELFDLAKVAGVAQKTLERARKKLDVIIEKPGFGTGWQWRFRKDGNGEFVVSTLPLTDGEPSNSSNLANLATFASPAEKQKNSPGGASDDDQLYFDFGQFGES